MAIDTRGKRASCLGIGLIALRAWPNPDGDLSGRGDRQHMAGLFAGVSTVAEIIVAGGVSRFRRPQRLHLWHPWLPLRVELECRPFDEPTDWGRPRAIRQPSREELLLLASFL